MSLDQFRYRLPIRVVFSDLDFYRHVNNAKYITWTETARIFYSAEVLDKPLGSPQNVIMASQTFHYEQQVSHDERLVMGCRVARIGRKSLDHVYELFRDGERVGHGTCALVAFDYVENRSIAVPDAWRERIRAYELVPPEE